MGIFFFLGTKMKIKILFFLVFCAGSCYCDEESQPRQGRVLFATTTTSTTTESTYAICWKASFSTVTGLYGCKRKRSTDRFTFRDDVPSHNEEIPQLSPTKSLTEDDICIDENVHEAGAAIEGSRGPADVREAKYLYYWATFTETFTSYTTTSVVCTPPGWTMTVCPASVGKKKK